MQKKIVVICAVVISIAAPGCQKDTPPPAGITVTGNYIVSAEAKRQFTKDEVKNIYSAYGAAPHIRNGIKTYSITYKTKTYTGADVTASASVIIPDAVSPYALVNYNHGTFFPSDEWRVPSYNNDFNSDINIGYMMAAVGYVVVSPDYIGYGSTKNLEHNYGDYHNIAVNAIDAIRAAKEFCSNQHLVLKNKLFITGWSEGGTVTMAIVKKIQTDLAAEFNITAAAPLAGAYYSSGMANQIVQSNTETPFINSYAWVVKTYNKTGNINKPLSYYMNEPHATWFSNSVETVIPRNPQLLFTNTFRQNYLNNSEPLKAVFLQNDLSNFKPACKIILCHGQNDTYIPLMNSQQAYNYMLAQGANVSLVTYPGKEHGECIWDYLFTIYQAFEPLR